MRTTKHTLKIGLVMVTLSATSAFAQMNLVQLAQNMDNAARIANDVNQIANAANSVQAAAPDGGCFINSLGLGAVSWPALLALAGLTSTVLIRRRK